MQVRPDINSRCFKKNKKYFIQLTQTKKKSIFPKKKKNKSKQHFNKTYNNHSRSKSNNKKVSPLNIRKSKLNNSPHKKKSKSKSTQLSNRKAHTHRDNDKKYHMLSTKIVTQRSPYIQKHINTKNSPQKKKREKKKIKKIKGKQNVKPIEHQRVKMKKQIPYIKTNFSDRRQSYFDQNVLKLLNIKHSESVRKQQMYHEQFGISQKKEIDQKDQKDKRKSYRDFGTITDSQNILNQRDIQSFRKQQQLKWRILCLQLSNFKDDKINQNKKQVLNAIINESKQNIQRVIEDEKRLLNFKSLDCYIIESPNKVRKALRKQRRSFQQQRQIIKNHSDRKLLHQLQNMQNIQNMGEISFIKDQSQKNSFCKQFQKQLQSYQNQGNPNIFNSISYIPQIQLKKANQIYQTIQNMIFLQFCQQIAKKQHILHQYLLCIKQNQINQQTINASNYYTINIVNRLFQYIIQNNQSQKIIHTLNIPFGYEPIKNLKQIRNYFKQVSQSHSSIQQTPQPILDTQLLNQFDSTNYNVPVQSQYFYHHCIYGCINQLLDTFRPFGTQGRPPLFILDKCSSLKQIKQIKERVIQKFEQLISICMGKNQFSEQEINPVAQMEKTFRKMDKSIVEQQEIKWKSYQGIKFQNTYVISNQIFQTIINEEILVLLTQFSI